MARIRSSNNQVNITQYSNVVKVFPQIEKVVTVIKDNKVVVRAPGIAGPKGNPGNSTLVGEGSPTIETGLVGDLYVDINNKRLYGPKDILGWDLNNYTVLSGSSFYTGSSSPSNSLGNNGDSYLNTTTGTLYTKTSNIWSNPTPLVAVSLFSFDYEKQSSSNQWNIVHNLGFRPAVSVMDYGSNNVECDVEHVSENHLTLTFSEAISGYAYLS
jgi:hypothetical protein